MQSTPSAFHRMRCSYFPKTLLRFHSKSVRPRGRTFLPRLSLKGVQKRDGTKRVAWSAQALETDLNSQRKGREDLSSDSFWRDSKESSPAFFGSWGNAFPLRLVAMFCLLAAFVTGGGHAFGALPGEDPTMDHLVTLYRASNEVAMRLHIRNGSGSTKTKKMEKELMAEGTVSALLYARTGELQFKKSADYWLGEVIAAFEQAESHHWPGANFDEYRAFAMMIYYYDKLGLLNAETRRGLLGYARLLVRSWAHNKLVKDLPDSGVISDAERKLMKGHNIMLGTMVGGAAVCRVFGKEAGEQVGKMERQIDLWWKCVIEAADLDENSSNYTWLGQSFLLDLARILDREAELKESENFKRMLLRNRYWVSATGIVPEFGDGYFDLGKVRMDLIYVLETAARWFHEPTCRGVVEKLLESSEAAGGSLVFADRGFSLLQLEPFMETTAPLPDSATLVTERIGSGRTGLQPDKLRLSTGWGAGNSTVWLDVYAQGSHAHPDQRPQVTYYEVDGVPFYRSMGRRVESPVASTSFWIAGRSRDFIEGVKPFSWNTAEFDLKEVLEDTRSQLALTEAHLLFATSVSAERALLLDNCRLIGAKGERLLNGFENERPVKKSESVFTASLTKDATQGENALRVVRNKVKGAGKNAYFSFPLGTGEFRFDPSDYDRLAIDFRVETLDGLPTRISLHHLGQHTGGDLSVKQQLRGTPLNSELVEAKAFQLARNAYGETRFSNYIEQDTEVRRQFLLASDGVLFIRDTCVPGKEGFTGGQLWNLYTLGERGSDWFVCRSVHSEFSNQDRTHPEKRQTMPKSDEAKPDRILVKFMSQPGLNCGVHGFPTEESSHKPEVQIAYGHAPLISGKTNQFAMVVIPLHSKRNARSVADSVVFTRDHDAGVQVTISGLGANAVTLELRDNRAVAQGDEHSESLVVPSAEKAE